MNVKGEMKGMINGKHFTFPDELNDLYCISIDLCFGTCNIGKIFWLTYFCFGKFVSF